MTMLWLKFKRSLRETDMQGLSPIILHSKQLLMLLDITKAKILSKSTIIRMRLNLNQVMDTMRSTLKSGKVGLQSHFSTAKKGK